MIRGLLKLGTLALAGYAVYSLYDIFAHGAGSSDQGGGEKKAFAGGQGGRRAEAIPDFGTEVGGARMTGGGRGAPEVTGETVGTMASHRVGRGVIRR